MKAQSPNNSKHNDLFLHITTSDWEILNSKSELLKEGEQSTITSQNSEKRIQQKQKQITGKSHENFSTRAWARPWLRLAVHWSSRVHVLTCLCAKSPREGIVFGFYHLKFEAFFDFATTRSTRSNHQYKLYVKLAKLNCYKHSFFVRIVKLWNELPRDIVEADNFQLFKSKLKLYLNI